MQMKVDLLLHNQRAYEKIREALASGARKLAISHATGTKMNLARQAVNEGVIISNKNQIYYNVNLYFWYKTNIDKFTSEESEIMNRLVPNNHTRKVLVVDIEDGKFKTYPSIAEAGRALCNEFHLVKTEVIGRQTICDRLTGRTKNPIYKGRFRFEYVEDQKPLKEKSPTIKKVSS